MFDYQFFKFFYAEFLTVYIRVEIGTGKFTFQVKDKHKHVGKYLQFNTRSNNQIKP